MSNDGKDVERVLFVILDSKQYSGEALSLLRSFSSEKLLVLSKTLWVLPSRETLGESSIKRLIKFEKFIHRLLSQSPTQSSATPDEPTKTSSPRQRKSILRRANHVCSNLSKSSNRRLLFGLATSRNLPLKN